MHPDQAARQIEIPIRARRRDDVMLSLVPFKSRLHRRSRQCGLPYRSGWSGVHAEPGPDPNPRLMPRIFSHARPLAHLAAPFGLAGLRDAAVDIRADHAPTQPRRAVSFRLAFRRLRAFVIRSGGHAGRHGGHRSGHDDGGAAPCFRARRQVGPSVAQIRPESRRLPCRITNVETTRANRCILPPRCRTDPAPPKTHSVATG